MKIGILGLTLRPSKNVGGNLGCYALGYSFFEILNEIAIRNNKQIDIVNISAVTPKNLLKEYLKNYIKSVIGKEDVKDYYSSLYSNLTFRSGFILENGKVLRPLHSVTSCDYVFDFTAGDSFTDIYGEERFYKRTQIKESIIKSGTPLVLGSQTIGPFIDSEVKRNAVSVLDDCYKVFTRDEMSFNYVEKISRAHPVLTTDVAFYLPYEKHNETKKEKKKAGFNPSGLLWLGGYDKTNQFGLTVNYQDYCRDIISHFIKSGYEVHLILHAFYLKGQKRDDFADNDRIAVEALAKEFPNAIISPFFKTPMEAKSYISDMDLFIGARMHATIAAISSGVPVIPFSYSRKFEGLFSSLNYPYVVEGTKWSTQKAISDTIRWIDSVDVLKENIAICKAIIDEKNKYLFEEYEKIILNK